MEPYKRKPIQEYCGHEVQVMGQAKVKVEYGLQRNQLPLCVVVENLTPPLFIFAKYSVKLSFMSSINGVNRQRRRACNMAVLIQNRKYSNMAHVRVQ